MFTSAETKRQYKKNNMVFAVGIYSAVLSLCLPVSLSLGSFIMALVSHSGTVHLLLHNLFVLCCTVIEPYRAAVELSIVTDGGRPVADDSLDGKCQWSICGKPRCRQ